MEAKFEQLNIKDDNIIETKQIETTVSTTTAITDIKLDETSPTTVTTTSTIPKTKKRITPKLISTSIDSSTSTTPNPFNFNYDLSAPISTMFSAFFSKPTNQTATTIITTSIPPTATTTTTTTTNLTPIITTTPHIIPTSITTDTTTSSIKEKKTKKRIEKDKEIKEKRKRKERIRKKPSSSVSVDDTDDKSTTASGASNTYYDDADDDADQDESTDKKKSTILPPSQPTTKKSTSPSLKKKKKVKVSKTLNILEPFSFLISMAPNVHALFYLDLKDWIFSDDLNIELLPFTSNNTDKLESNGIDIKELIKIINNNELLELNKSKLVIISDIYNINLKNSSSTLVIDNNKFLKAQKELWWVKTTNKWFMKPTVMKQSSHFKIWFGFLVLELWYRFIWAYHTQSVYNTLIGDNKLVCGSSGNSVLDELQMEIDGHHHSSTNSNGNHHNTMDEVIDLDDLGKGDEEDDEEEEEDDDEDDDEIIIYEGEDNTNPIYNKSSLKDSNSGSKKDTSCSDQHSSTSSDDSMDVDDDEEKEDDDEEKEDKEEEKEINNNEDDESSMAKNNTAQLELIPTMVPIFFVHDTITESINEIEAEYWDTGIWNIRKAIDTFSQFIHSYYRDSKSLPSLTFAEIHENIHKFYNKKYKSFINDQCITIDGQDGYNWSWSNESVATSASLQTTPQTTSQTATTATTTASVNETTKPLLLLSTPPQPTPQQPKNRLLEFVNEINVQQFSNLTQNGVVSHSHNFYYLFPFFTDMKPPTHPISDYYLGLKRRLEKQGVYNKEVEKIVETLDRLLEERALINRSSIQSENICSSGAISITNNINNNNNNNNNSSVPSVLKAVDDYQNTRIKYLDELIVTLKAEYHKLTNKVDQLPSTKKTSKLRPPTTAIQSTTTLENDK